jgi:TM2 domain-containing membrane protein YozV
MAESSEKTRLVALLLCFFVGVLGVHRFYVGKIGTGVAMILTFGGLGIWALIDLIMIICGAFKDSEGNAVTEWT